MNKVYKYFILILLIISPIACRPFSISAESGSLSAPFVGFNVHVIDIDSQLNQIDRGNYRIASHTYGATGQLNCSSWRSAADVSSPCDVYELENQSNSQVAGIQIKVGDISLTNLTNDQFTGTIINRIYEIEFILDNSYKGYITFSESGNQYTDYINGTSFKHNFWSTSAQSFDITIVDYQLNRVSNTVMWDIPFESLGANQYVLSRVDNVSGYQIYDFLNFNSYNFPIYALKAGSQVTNQVMSASGNRSELLYIFGVRNNPININNIYTLFRLDSSKIQATSIETLNSVYQYQTGYGSNLTFYKIKFKNISGGTYFLDIILNENNIFMPIYINYPFLSDTVSTDFALLWGLNNRLLNDLDLLANGNNQSNNSSDNLDDNNSTMSDTIGEYDSIENNFNNSLNNSLNNIDTNNTPSAMGSKFQASAIWVTNQFNRMTNNTPFGSILGFSLLLGLSLLIIGRVFK